MAIKTVYVKVYINFFFLKKSIFKNNHTDIANGSAIGLYFKYISNRNFAKWYIALVTPQVGQGIPNSALNGHKNPKA